jgi:hypothetical protein
MHSFAVQRSLQQTPFTADPFIENILIEKIDRDRA